MVQEEAGETPVERHTPPQAPPPPPGDSEREAPPSPRQTPPGERVITDLEVEAVLEGIPFARLPSDPARMCSAPITNKKVVDRLCSIPGFARANGSLTPEDEDAIDAEIAGYARQAKLIENARLSASGLDPLVLQRTVDELTRANQAQAQELNETRAKLVEAERALAGSEVPRLQRQIELLREQNDQGGGASLALEQDNERLRAANAALSSELQALKAGAITA
jgi:hypothetical protein